MKIRSGFMRGLLTLGIILLMLPAASFTQDKAESSDELALAVANASKANHAAMMKYTWRIKTDLSAEGESKATVLTEMRYNTEGELESTNIGGESHVQKKRGLRGRMQQSKMEDFAEYLGQVLDQSFKYIFLSKGTLVDIFDRGEIKHADDSIDISARNIFVKADSLFLSVDPDTRLTKTLSFSTTLGEDTIKGVVKMKMIEDGPNRPIRLEIEIPGQAVKITSETYDWIEQK